MATKAFKSEKIDALKSKIEKAQVAIVTEYKGYTVEEITNLRRAIQKDGGDYGEIPFRHPPQPPHKASSSPSTRSAGPWGAP